MAVLWRIAFAALVLGALACAAGAARASEGSDSGAQSTSGAQTSSAGAATGGAAADSGATTAARAHAGSAAKGKTGVHGGGGAQATPGSQSKPSLSNLPGTQSTPPPAPQLTRPSWLKRWLSETSIIPIPEIAEDPYSGTTVGVIPTYLVTGPTHDIERIFAPDVIYNQYFGWGAHGRLFAYPSADTEWSLVGGAKQRVESDFDGEYATGIQRDERWSFNASVVYDRNGSQRYYGTGNDTHVSGETNYTDQQKYIQTTVGLNLNHTWQLGYTFRARTVDISAGHLTTAPSIQELYPGTVLRAEKQEILNRFLITYDTRNDVVVPTQGAEWVAYGGAASSEGMFNASLYSELGIDGRNFWSLPDGSVLAFHMALRYMPRTARTRNIPFWALSSIGGDDAIIGGDQPLRGFGTGRFRDRNSSSFSVEYRRRVASFDAFSTRIALELAPFVDMGRVYNSFGTDPLSSLHKAAGIGFRGIALPFVVGYVDVGYGSEGAAVFTGLNYPF